MNQARVTIPHSARKFSVEQKTSSPPAKGLDARPNPQAPAEPAPAPPQDVDRLGTVIAHVNRIAQRLDQIAKQRDEDLGELRSLAIHLGITAAERILEQEFAAGRHAITEQITAALGDYKSSESIQLALNPQDVKLFKSPSPNLSVVADPSIDRGNCRMVFDEYVMERDWREQLARIRDALLLEADDARSEH